MGIAATRHFITTAAGRAVHLRRLGAGPPVVLVHESPRSSVALLPLAERLASRFTVFALDTPGYGGSDPLADPSPEITQYAHALAETFDTLGLGCAPLYGTHTGAAIALEFARLYPERTAVAVLDGYPMFTEAEREDLLHAYLPPFRPAFDGTHVAWAWSRVRDQFSFFPWYRAGRAARFDRSPPPLDIMQQVVADMLAAGDGYRVGYAAAFRYEAAAPLGQLTAPAWFVARDDDLLFPHLDRLPDLPPGCGIERLDADRDRWAAAIADIMARHPGDADAPAMPALPALFGGGPHRRYLQGGGGSLLLRSDGPASGRPLMLLHPLPGGGRQIAPLMRRLARTRPVLAPDLPGSGESDDAPLDVLQALDLPEMDIVALGASAATALDLGHLAHRLVLVDPPPARPRDPAVIDRELPDLTPRWHGGHLAAAWHMLRDDLIFKPWYDRRRQAARRLGVDIDVETLQGRFTDLVRAGPAGIAAAKAMLTRAVDGPLRDLGDKLRVVAITADPDLEDVLGLAETAAPAGPAPDEIAEAVESALETED